MLKKTFGLLVIMLFVLSVSLITAAEVYTVIIQGSSPNDGMLPPDAEPTYGNYSYMDEFWQDPLLLYLALQNTANPEKPGLENNIFVLWGDGSQWGYEDTTYQPRYRVPYVDMSASRENLEIVCDYLSGVVTNEDILLVYTFDHGGFKTLYLYQSFIYDTAFARLFDQISYKYRWFGMQQCYSGSFIPALANEQTVVMASCDSIEGAWRADDILKPGDTLIAGIENERYESRIYHHGEWNFHLLTGFWGGIMPSLYWPGPIFRDLIDTDSNGKISLAEIHNWILARDSQFESPQLSDPGNFADQFYVWPEVEIGTTGIKNPDIRSPKPVPPDQFVKVGPNPCYGIVKFIPQVNKRLTYSVFNASGRLVVKTDQSTIKISTAGVYFYQVAMDNKVVQTGKLVILK